MLSNNPTETFGAGTAPRSCPEGGKARALLLLFGEKAASFRCRRRAQTRIQGVLKILPTFGGLVGLKLTEAEVVQEVGITGPTGGAFLQESVRPRKIAL